MTAESMRRIAILGAGGMGTALALLFRETEAVRLWSRATPRTPTSWRGGGQSPALPGIRIPEDIGSRPRGEAMDGAELIVAAIPSSFLRATLTRWPTGSPPSVPFLSVVKGIENGTFARPSQIIVETLGDRPVAVLSGPSHAEEIARGLPASVVVAGTSEALNRAVQETLSHEAFRVYTNPDAVGVELAGALKNILGIAAGICDGLGFGDNAKAALLTRGLVEIARLGVDLGGRRRRSTAWPAWATWSRPATARSAATGRSASGSAGARRSSRSSPAWSTWPRACPPRAASTPWPEARRSRCRSPPSSTRCSSRGRTPGRP